MTERGKHRLVEAFGVRDRGCGYTSTDGVSVRVMTNQHDALA